MSIITTIQAEQSEQQLIDMAAAAVRQSNWTIGEAASRWTERYAAGRTDADFAELIGSSQPTVNLARRVFGRFLLRRNKHEEFTWTQWRTLLTWDDAEEFLDWADATDATFPEMRAYRRAQRGEDLHSDSDDELNLDTCINPGRASEPHEPIVHPPERDDDITREKFESAVSTPVGDNEAPSEKCSPPMKAPADDAESRPHVTNNSGEFEWYTPAEIVDTARHVMGTIDLDPASCEVANEVVKATMFYDQEQNGLNKEWEGRVWLNPPYASGLVGEFVDTLLHYVDLGDIEQACVLVNNATETKWFQALAEKCDALCFPRKRIRFWCPGRDLATGLQGQAVVYFGARAQSFRQLFSAQGVTVER
jgi:ParB family chromosome partitioning protein